MMVLILDLEQARLLSRLLLAFLNSPECGDYEGDLLMPALAKLATEIRKGQK